VEGGLRSRYGCCVEDRKSWLPAGLEGSGWEPDDRASQRRDAKSGKRSGGGSDASGAPRHPTASGTWQPYDPERPESKRGRATSEPGKAEPAKGDEPSTPEAKRDEPPEPAAKRDEPSEPAAKRDKPSEARGERESDQERSKPAEKQPRSERKSSDDAAGAAGADEPGGSREGRSDVDAMGQDKHRKVVGQRFGASRAKQVAYYGIFVAFVIVAYIGLKTAADHLDKAPAHDTNQAPWSKPGAPDEPLGGFTPKTPGQKGPTRFQ
jgi:hypothetical protein